MCIETEKGMLGSLWIRFTFRADILAATACQRQSSKCLITDCKKKRFIYPTGCQTRYLKDE